jgi:Tfp pilus assembly protein PilN
MFRINLLPKEVLERRRYEGWYRWVFILAIGLILIVGATWLLLTIEVNLKQGDLQSIAEQSQSTKAQAEQLSVFQDKEEELQKRQVVAQTALAGRVNVGQVANDISLVLPDEVWLDLLTINQDTGVVLSANTPRNAGQSTDVAYKSVAKTLVRLNELPELYDVWLNTASNGTWSQWAPRVVQTGTGLAVKVVAFQASGKVVRPASTAGAAAGAGSAGASSSTGGTHTVGAANAAQNAVNQMNSQTPTTSQ